MTVKELASVVAEQSAQIKGIHDMLARIGGQRAANAPAAAAPQAQVPAAAAPQRQGKIALPERKKTTWGDTRQYVLELPGTNGATIGWHEKYGWGVKLPDSERIVYHKMDVWRALAALDVAAMVSFIDQHFDNA